MYVRGGGKVYLHVSSPPIKIHVQVLDFAVVTEQFLEIFFAGFFVHVGDEDNPAFDGADGDCARGCARL